MPKREDEKRKMKKNTLVLITKNFPYGIGETFIENELEIAKTKFRQIIILVYQADIKKGKRQVPENVRVIPLETKSRSQKLLFSLRLFSSPYNLIEVFKEMKNYSNLFEKRRCCSFYLESVLKEYQARGALKDIFKEKTDFILYSYWLTDTSYLGYRLLKYFDLLGKKTFVSRGHGYDLYKERNNGVEFPFRTQIFDVLTKIYPCSEQGEKYLEREYGLWKKKYKASYLGVMGGNKLKRYKKKDEFHLVTCSNIIPLKRLERLAKALYDIETQYPNVANDIQWTCFGDGESEYSLRKFCEMNLKNVKVRFEGRMKNKEIIDFYHSQKVDLFINVSETEGLPVSIMEAMSNGIPVIATDVGGTSEIVKDNVNGILLKKDFDNSQLVESILMFFNMPLQKQEEFSEQAYYTWQRKFDCIKNYNDFYDEILGL